MSHVWIVSLVLLFGLWGPGAIALQAQTTPTPPTVAIQAPAGGQALQGVVPVIGTTQVEGFLSAELAFAYEENPTDTWFLIAQSFQPITANELAQWDTTTITDGVYSLRLTVLLSDGGQRTATIDGLRVRNYTPIETDTPPPETVTPTPAPAMEKAPPTAIPAPSEAAPTPTPPASNPAKLDSADVLRGMGKGALLAAGLFALGGLYSVLRASSRRK